MTRTDRPRRIPVDPPDASVAAVWTVSAAVILAALPTLPGVVTGDEGFADVGYQAFRHYFLERDFAAAFWFERMFNYGSPNPRLGPMILGALTWLFKDVLLSNPGSGTVILGVRVVVSLISAGTVAVFYDWMRRVFASRSVGLIGAALLLASPVFRSCQSLMLPDPLMAFFVVVTLRAVTRWSASYALGAHWMETILVGVLLGVAVSTRLYAVALIAPIAVVLLLKSLSFPARTLASAVVIAVCSLAVFALTNPLILMRPRVAVLEMTSRHLLRAGETNGGVNPGQIPYIVEVPFDSFRPRAYPTEGILDDPGNTVRGPGNPRVPWAVGLAALGLAIASRRRAWLPVVWAAAAFLVIGRVVAAMNPTWIMAKVFLLPAIGIAALQALPIDAAVQYLRTRRDGRDGVVAKHNP